MLSNDGERLKVVQSMKNPHDYREFERVCTEKGITPLRVGEYAQKLGMLLVGRALNPDLPDSEAYMELIAAMNNDLSRPRTLPTSPEGDQGAKRSCGGCGGGTVR